MAHDTQTSPTSGQNEQHQVTLKHLFGKDLAKLDKDSLRLELVKAQYDLRATRTEGQATGLLVMVNGIELSGKGRAVSQLREWVDPRLLNVEATLGQKPAKYEPIWQRHTPKLPRHGNITAYFGNWYADLIVAGMAMRTVGEDWQDYVTTELDCLTAFEADLSNNHTKLLKCWFDIDEATLSTRLQDADADPNWLYGIDWQNDEAVANYRMVSDFVRQHQGDWQTFDGAMAQDFPNSQDLPFIDELETQFALHVLSATYLALQASNREDSQTAESYRVKSTNAGAAFSWADIPDKLTDIDDPDMDKSDYKKRLASKQARFAELIRQHRTDTPESPARHIVFAFEGMDAAGKGGAIKRLVSPLDPREYQIYNIAAPTEIELQHPYLWRFWTRLPELEPSFKEERLSRIAIFDRTWYGRVLVERIEGYASEAAWQRAYDEINRMEADLHAHGTLVIKYWMAIDKHEQLERFEDREDTPHKQFKLTEDDWRNRDKWHDYVQAAADMLARTSTRDAPWHVIATNDKRTARLAVLDHAIGQLENL